MRYARLGMIGVCVLLTGCVAGPRIPSVTVFKAYDKSFDQYQVDDQQCRVYANQTLAEQESAELRNLPVSTIVGAVLGTALGAGIGAATGNVASGAAIGAAVGGVGGTAHGLSSTQQAAIMRQQRFDSAFSVCMDAAGHRVQMPPQPPAVVIVR